MDHGDLYLLRETYNEKHILLCFNGPFSQGLIEEIGSALKNHLHSEAASSSAAMDVFAVYIEIAQNIREYSALHNFNDHEASATVVIGRDANGHYEISAGNIVEPQDGALLVEKVNALALMDKTQLRAAYKEQLRQPRHESDETLGAGLGLIDIARKASAPFSCALRPVNTGHHAFFSLRVVI